MIVCCLSSVWPCDRLQTRRGFNPAASLRQRELTAATSATLSAHRVPNVSWRTWCVDGFFSQHQKINIHWTAKDNYIGLESVKISPDVFSPNFVWRLHILSLPVFLLFHWGFKCQTQTWISDVKTPCRRRSRCSAVMTNADQLNRANSWDSRHTDGLMHSAVC